MRLTIFSFALSMLVIAGIAQAQPEKPAVPEPQRLFLGSGGIWSASGDFPSLQDCDLAARDYASMGVSAGCAPLFSVTAEECAKSSGVQVIVKPEHRVNILGTAQRRFDFDKCMNASGYPIE